MAVDELKCLTAGGREEVWMSDSDGGERVVSYPDPYFPQRGMYFRVLVMK